MQRVIAIIQARMGSTRFPGKMMVDLEGYPIIRWVLERLQRAQTVDQVILATSTLTRDDPLVGQAEALGVAVFRGDEEDVLGRFIEAANIHKAGAVVRVCGDNPLIAPEAVDLLVREFISSTADYAFNHIPRNNNDYPDGLGAEITHRETLENIAKKTIELKYREHVASYIWDHPADFSILTVACPDAWKDPQSQIKLDIDNHSDLQLLRKLCRNMTFDVSISEILERWQTYQCSCDA